MGKLLCSSRLATCRCGYHTGKLNLCTRKTINVELSTSILDVQYSKTGHVKTELNLRGKTVDEAWTETDKYIDDAFLAGLPRVRIIHGKGTGALRNAIHDLLQDHAQVNDFQVGSTQRRWSRRNDCHIEGIVKEIWTNILELSACIEKIFPRRAALENYEGPTYSIHRTIEEDGFQQEHGYIMVTMLKANKPLIPLPDVRITNSSERGD